jgi:hypothetical protein
MNDAPDPDQSRREIDRRLMALVIEIRDDVQTLRAGHLALADEVTRHMRAEDEWRKGFLAAFPAEDLRAHRLEHEAEERAARELSGLKTHVLRSVITGLVWAVIVFTTGSTLYYLQRQVFAPPPAHSEPRRVPPGENEP